MTALTRLALACLALFMLASAACPTNANSSASREYEVKAAFLYNFAKFTTWPPDAFATADAPLVVGVLGKDPFGATLDGALNGKQVGARRLVIERYAGVEQLGRCHVLFVADSERERHAEILKACEGRPTLVVCDIAGFAAKGATASFYIEKNNVRFEMNPAAAKRARIQLSSQLLKLAKLVEDGERA